MNRALIRRRLVLFLILLRFCRHRFLGMLDVLRRGRLRKRLFADLFVLADRNRGVFHVVLIVYDPLGRD